MCAYLLLLIRFVLTGVTGGHLRDLFERTLGRICTFHKRFIQIWLFYKEIYCKHHVHLHLPVNALPRNLWDSEDFRATFSKREVFCHLCFRSMYLEASYNQDPAAYFAVNPHYV